MTVFHLDVAVLTAVLIGLRITGLMLTAPFLSHPAIPVAQKAALALVLTVLLYSLSAGRVALPEGMAWVTAAFAEAGLGMLLGMAAQLVVEAAQMAGQIAGFQAGYSLVTLLDPQTQADTPVLSTFFGLLGLLLFLQLGVDGWLLRALAASFNSWPAGGAMARVSAAAGWLPMATTVWSLGLRLAAPVVVATALVDVGLAFLAKASPQLPVLFVGLPIKTMLSLLLLSAALWGWPQILGEHFAGALVRGERLLHAGW